jgi:hypothetical protein
MRESGGQIGRLAALAFAARPDQFDLGTARRIELDAGGSDAPEGAVAPVTVPVTPAPVVLLSHVRAPLDLDGGAEPAVEVAVTLATVTPTAIVTVTVTLATSIHGSGVAVADEFVAVALDVALGGTLGALCPAALRGCGRRDEEEEGEPGEGDQLAHTASLPRIGVGG